ncbi:MAG: NADH-quinone oxidoreductase subunit C [Bacillaceae bacterium]|nr:NADH-quinone oxidoreductase subunit C [Bacillaceae bacterium]
MSDQEKKEPTAEEKAKAAEEAKKRAKQLAAEKAKAAAEAKKKAAEKMEQQKEPEPSGQDDKQQDVKESESGDTADADAKAKAAAAAKAKAAAAAKAKAAAAAKAKAAAAAKAKAAREKAGDGDDADSAKAKAAAAAKAKAAAAAKAKAAAAARAKAAGAGKAEEDKPKEPSPNQPMLDHIVKVLTSNMGEDVIEESYINELAKDEPTLIINNEKWHEAAKLLHDHPELGFDYISGLQGVDYEDHMEVVYSFLSFKNKGKRVTVKVKTDREESKVASVTDIWKGADWNERETYDLLGIVFEGHQNLKRILLPDDWVGHPLRKDYEQLDEEV